MIYNILKHTIKHTCKAGKCFTGGKPPENHLNTLELPSSVFIDMTQYLKKVLPVNTYFPPE